MDLGKEDKIALLVMGVRSLTLRKSSTTLGIMQWRTVSSRTVHRCLFRVKCPRARYGLPLVFLTKYFGRISGVRDVHLGFDYAQQTTTPT